MAVSRVLHFGALLQFEAVVHFLPNQLSSLVHRLGNVVEVTTTNHENLGLTANLNKLEVVGEVHCLALSLSVLAQVVVDHVLVYLH